MLRALTAAARRAATEPSNSSITNSNHDGTVGTMAAMLVTVLATLLLVIGSGVVLVAVAVMMSAPLGGLT